MRQILNVVILASQRGVSGGWQGRVGFLEHSQDSGRGDGGEGCGQFEDVVGVELHLLQAGSSGGGGGGAGAGVERVCLGAVGQPVLLQLQVTGQCVDVMNNLRKRKGRVSLTAQGRNDRQRSRRGRMIMKKKKKNAACFCR